jgi:hypothetical protein
MIQIDIKKYPFFVGFDTKPVVVLCKGRWFIMCHQPQVFTASYLHLDFPIRGTSCTLCQPFLSHPIYNKMVNKSVTLECTFC